ncbi:alpha/beta-hydrolase [Anaeromyces robustus]|uniref:Alpha/beta-hydrolase n=1 Tax=Anaeromyces robustus TaxID=1754192 RepID=A0A1Y1V672_9FUNG|nr:alpha/beta-hydrolase [Anaeromyces robustus]|eukprot:ORX47676.1 alpha/beta-hydrolase [Anaeromyces robustus]
MKATTLLSVVFSVIAAKVSAECFSVKLGYPCCTKTNEVIYTDEQGQWGVEDYHWCGIDNTQNAAENPWEQQPQQPEIDITPVANFRYKQNNIQYPSPQKITYFSSNTNSERKMNIILPVGYDESKKYPIVYFLHGIFGDEDSMLDESNEVEPGFSQKYFDGYDNFINELVDDNTALCGFSMGGRNSLYIAYKRSDLFGYVGAFSPAPGVTPGDDFSGHHPGLFTEEQFRSDDPPYVTLISCVPGADHNEDAISAGLYNFVQTIFGALNN